MTLSRRQILLGMAAAGSGVAVCACSSIGTLSWLALQKRSTTPLKTNAAPVTPAATATSSGASQPQPKPDVISRDAWGALPPDHSAPNETGFASASNPGGWKVYERELHVVYNTVVVHHSVIYRLTDPLSVREIQILHRQDRGWADVAYHFFVGKNGLIYEGRDIGVRGVHVRSYNTGLLGICLLGDFRVTKPRAPQLTAARDLILWATDRLQLTHLADHRAFNADTECPGAELLPYIPMLADAAGLTVGTDGYIAPDNVAGSAGCPCCDDDSCIS